MSKNRPSFTSHDGRIRVWPLPGGTSLQAMWLGPGTGIYVTEAFTPGAPIIPVDHPEGNGKYATADEAYAAVVRVFGEEDAALPAAA